METLFDIFGFQANNPLQLISIMFVLLFSGFYILYAFYADNIKVRNILLLLFSLFFYYKMGEAFVLLLIFMASSDFFIGKAMAKSQNIKKRRFLLISSLVINISCLAFFKYLNFILQSWWGFFYNEPSPFLLNIVQPIGISFYMFKTLTYIFDIYYGSIDVPEKKYTNYLLYVSFFPNIIAGPITKARDLLPQFNQPTKITEMNVNRGFFLIIMGAFKKVCVADFIAVNFVNRVYDSPTLFTGFENLMAAYGATLQIYCDFAGYTDIVLGIALLLGFSFQHNFNQPFIAQNITDFWKRWHITLSRWLNEYLFYPLSFSFRSFSIFGTMLAVMLTFIISGIWHGPKWTYILWGSAHGVALAWDIASQSIRGKIKNFVPKTLYKFMSIFLTFHFIVFSVILFKSGNMSMAVDSYRMIFYKTDFSVAGQWINLYLYPFLVMLLGFILHFLPLKLNSGAFNIFSSMHWSVKSVVFFFLIFIIYQFYSAESQAFIYLSF